MSRFAGTDTVDRCDPPQVCYGLGLLNWGPPEGIGRFVSILRDEVRIRTTLDICREASSHWWRSWIMVLRFDANSVSLANSVGRGLAKVARDFHRL